MRPEKQQETAFDERSEWFLFQPITDARTSPREVFHALELNLTEEHTGSPAPFFLSAAGPESRGGGRRRRSRKGPAGPFSSRLRGRWRIRPRAGNRNGLLAASLRRRASRGGSAPPWLEREARRGGPPPGG